MTARTFAIGDIHGCHIAFDTMLSRLALTSDDTVVILGDLVDRGPGTRQVIEQAMQLRSACNLIVIMGNHEEMLLAAPTSKAIEGMWLANGGYEALASYGGEYSDIPESHLEFIRSFANYHEGEHDIFIHANLQPGVALEDQTGEWLRWMHLTHWEPMHPSGKRAVCGHTKQRSGLPLLMRGWACIDTAACDGKYLTCLNVETDEVLQSQQSGSIRGPALLRDIGVHPHQQE